MRLRRLSIDLTVVLTLVLVPGVAAAGTIRVDDDGKASATDCNAGKVAPKLIGTGIAKAGAGGTVIVCPGTYREAIAITGTRDGITIKGATKRTARVLRPAVLPSEAFLVTINSEVDGALISGLAFGVPASGACTTKGLVTTAGRAVRLIGNSFTGRAACLTTAVQVAPTTPGGTVSATVKGNLVKNVTGVGIDASGSATTVSITGNTIRNTLGEMTPSTIFGIYLHHGVAGIASGNTLIDANRDADRNTKPTMSPAIEVLDVHPASLTTMVKGNTITAGNGIWLQSVSNVGVRDNTVTSPIVADLPTAYTGIQLNSATGNAVTGNTVSGASYGVFVYYDGSNSSGNTVSGNVLTGNSKPCFDNNFSPFNTWTDNIVDDGKTCPVSS